MSGTVKFFPRKDHANRKLMALAGKFPDTTFAVEEEEGNGFFVAVYLTEATLNRKGPLDDANVRIHLPGVKETEVNTHHETVQHDAPPVVDEKAAAKIALEAEKAKARAEKAAAKEARKAADLESRAEVARIKAEVKAAKKAAKDAEPKPEKTPRTPREPGTGNWKDSYAKSIALAKARAAAGEPVFRTGTKREQLHLLLLNGVTSDDAAATVGWKKATVVAALVELGLFVGKKVVRDKLTDVYSYAE